MAATRPIYEIMNDGITALASLKEGLGNTYNSQEEQKKMMRQITSSADLAILETEEEQGEYEEGEGKDRPVTPRTKWVAALFEAFMKVRACLCITV